MKIYKCKSCGADIVWITTTKGKQMPCDAAAVKYQNNDRGKDVIVLENGDDIKAICAAADEAQAFGFRVCPRNVYADDIAKSICVCSGGKPCRKRFATCWKLYIKAAANNEHRAQ